MATQRSVMKRQRAFQEEMKVKMLEMASLLSELQEELHETKLAVLRVERKLKGDDSEES